MAQSYEQFLRQLLESGLMSEDDVKALVGALPEHEHPKDGEQLARLLVKMKRLTAYQAQQIYGGKGKSLVMGNYEILDKLGQGGMGLVLKARHRRMKREVALKILSPAVTKNAGLTARFQREVEAAAKLKHENIVTAYDADESNGTRFLVMEYVEGSDLSSYIRKHGLLPIVLAVEYILQAARGLDYAHKQRVTHRDIKPANLLLDLTGCVKILDMGLARIDGEIGEQAELTSTGAVMGTVDYMAPEQALNTKDADARSDIYSLGITLWYLLTGTPAFEGTSLMARMLAHRDAPVPSLRTARPEVTAELDAVFRKMIAKKPADRFQTMAEVVTALATCLGGSGGSTPSVSATGADDPSLMQFLTNLGNTNAPPSTKGISTLKTDAAIEATLIADIPELSVAETPTLIGGDASEITDPETMTGHALRSDRTRAVQPQKPSSKKSSRTNPGQNKSGGNGNANKKLLLFGGAGFLALIILLGIIIRIKNKDGSITEIKLPDGATVEILDDKAGRIAAEPAAPNFSLSPAGDFESKGQMVTFHDLLEIDDEMTLEMTLTPRTHGGETESRSIISFSGRLALKQYHDSLVWVRTNAGEVPEAENVFMRNLPLGKPLRIAAISTGKQLRLFVEGQLIDSHDLAISPTFTSNQLFLGSWHGPEGGYRSFDGTIDEIRLSKVARYDANYVPIQRLTADKQTVALYHCDEGTGTSLRDSSGNGHDVRLEGAKWVNADGNAARIEAEPAAPNFSLSPGGDLDSEGQIAELPRFIKLDDPMTVEMTITPYSNPGARENSTILSFAGALVLKQHQESLTWMRNNKDADPEYEEVRLQKLPVGKPLRIAAVSTGKQLRLFVEGILIGAQDLAISPSSQSGRIDLVLWGTKESRHTPFDGTIDEIRVSNFARYESDYVPTETLAADKQTVALYHCDEGIGNVLKDSSGNGHDAAIIRAKWIPVARIPAAISKSALTFPKSSSRVVIDAPFRMDEDFTAEMWVTPGELTSAEVPYQSIFGLEDQFGITLATSPKQNTYIRTIWKRDPQFDYRVVYSDTPIVSGKRIHLTLVYENDMPRFYLNGERASLSYDSEPRATPNESPAHIANSMTLGYIKHDVPDAAPFRGSIDSLRYTKGVRYREDFAPPAEFANDEQTIALYRFDEGTGDILKDSSGHGHDGKIIGAQWVETTE